ncbi:hypothetical protein N4T77_04575 [Clostridium sp. CX1]|uniref:hypothetical protein n=1 Tax=Clostridium sp. CX1 TaxID=2978346 RepID=UPI0021BE0CBD|nr:hypothetical protein [Clostridium sp. CX1]MCT8975867.1 hypothetical protein [Clostridium sp. CX1]
MVNYYGYLLIVILTLIIIGIYLSKFTPKKIRVITVFIVFCMLFRYVSLLIFYLSNNIKYLYVLKVFFFLNLIAVPLLALTALYIFTRKDNINFSYIFIAAAVLIGLYALCIYKCPSLLYNSSSIGYTMFFYRSMYIYWIYIMLNTIILFLTILLMGQKNLNKTGMYLVILSSFATILELVIWLVGITYPLERVVGDMFWVATLVYGLSRFRKKTVK